MTLRRRKIENSEVQLESRRRTKRHLCFFCVGHNVSKSQKKEREREKSLSHLQATVCHSPCRCHTEIRLMYFDIKGAVHTIEMSMSQLKKCTQLQRTGFFCLWIFFFSFEHLATRGILYTGRTPCSSVKPQRGFVRPRKMSAALPRMRRQSDISVWGELSLLVSRT